MESKLSEVPREGADRRGGGGSNRERERGIMKNKSKEEKTVEKYWRKLERESNP